MSDPFKPYADRYVNPQGAGDKRPTALQIVDDAGVRNRWSGKVALVTGATGELGIEHARALHATGADVYLTARNLEKGKEALDKIKGRSDGTGKLELIEMKLDSLASVRKAAGEFLNRSKKLNILVNVAGIMNCPQSKTEDGFETQFQVNYLSHYLLTVLLLPTMLASSNSAFNSRVVTVSSSSHRYATFNFDDYNHDKPGAYNGHLVYGHAKTAVIWMANYIDRHYGPRGVHALSVHPGFIWSNLQMHEDQDEIATYKANKDVSKLMRSAEQGAATSIWAAVGPVWEGRGGKYLTECGVADPAPDASPMGTGYASWAYEPESEDRLWALSSKLVGVEAP